MHAKPANGWTPTLRQRILLVGLLLFMPATDLLAGEFDVTIWAAYYVVIAATCVILYALSKAMPERPVVGYVVLGAIIVTIPPLFDTLEGEPNPQSWPIVWAAIGGFLAIGYFAAKRFLPERPVYYWATGAATAIVFVALLVLFASLT